MGDFLPLDDQFAFRAGFKNLVKDLSMSIGVEVIPVDCDESLRTIAILCRDRRVGETEIGIFEVDRTVGANSDLVVICAIEVEGEG